MKYMTRPKYDLAYTTETNHRRVLSRAAWNTARNMWLAHKTIKIWKIGESGERVFLTASQRADEFRGFGGNRGPRIMKKEEVRDMLVALRNGGLKYVGRDDIADRGLTSWESSRIAADSEEGSEGCSDAWQEIQHRSGAAWGDPTA